MKFRCVPLAELGVRREYVVGGLIASQHLAPGAGHDLINERLDFLVLLSYSAHHDGAALRVGNYRSRFTESVGAYDGGAAFLQYTHSSRSPLNSRPFELFE